jgi:hypothetical protein
MRVKIAVGAFLDAPRKMDVEAKRDRLSQSSIGSLTAHLIGWEGRIIEVQCMCVFCARRDSNSRPPGSKPGTLSN